jgi:hypothetical protein
MKKALSVFLVVVAICFSCSKPEPTEPPVDLVEQQRIETILTSHYWIISESTTPGYDDEKELSTVYWYKSNGELWTGKIADFHATVEKVAKWTLSGNILSETWLWNNVTWTQEVSSISDERLIFTDRAFKDGSVLGTRTYMPVTIE